MPDGPNPDPSAAATRLLPAFPLGSVLVPGLIMPLHIFEPRYRRLVHDLLELPEGERDFVIIAIRDGHEVGTEGVRALHDVGTIASLREVTPYEDGRYDIVTVGTDRVRIEGMGDDRPYLQVYVSDVPESSGPDTQILAEQVQQYFNTYRMLLSGGGTGEDSDDLPEDPRVLSYLVAAAMILELPDRQALLEEYSDSQRLIRERDRLKFELSMLRTIPSLPAVDLKSSAPSVN